MAIDSPKTIANRINEALLNPLARDRTTSSNETYDIDEEPSNHPLVVLTQEEVYNTLCKLNPRKAPGPDGIPNWILRDYAVFLAKPITSILNSSYQNKEIPTTWKYANVTPIPKQKPVTNVNKHLRPISLTQTISKVAEEIVVAKYIGPAILKIIDTNQFGAIPGSSTTKALISMIHEWAQATDGTSAAVRVVILDYTKAFDSIDHSTLFQKIRRLDIPCKIKCWVRDFLTDRYQRVKIFKDCYSEWGHVPLGVPQGTKLGPWLFLLMINDLKVRDSPIWKFVDDITASETVPKGNVSHIQQDVKRIETWSNSNKLELNPVKCKEFIIDFKQRKQQFDPILINNQPIEVVHHAKILGLTVSDNLLWKNHVNEANKKVNKRFFFLIQLKRAKVPAKDLIQFYTTCIRLILDYGAPVYHYTLSQYLQESLERIQKRALSIIFPEVSYQDGLQLSCLSSLSSRRQELCDKLFSSVAANSNHKLYNHLYKVSTANYNLRCPRTYDLPNIKTNRFLNTFIPSSCKFA